MGKAGQWLQMAGQVLGTYAADAIQGLASWVGLDSTIRRAVNEGQQTDQAVRDAINKAAARSQRLTSVKAKAQTLVDELSKIGIYLSGNLVADLGSQLTKARADLSKLDQDAINLDAIEQQITTRTNQLSNSGLGDLASGQIKSDKRKVEDLNKEAEDVVRKIEQRL